jgi:hypothetical protein
MCPIKRPINEALKAIQSGQAISGKDVDLGQWQKDLEFQALLSPFKKGTGT